MKDLITKNIVSRGLGFLLSASWGLIQKSFLGKGWQIAAGKFWEFALGRVLRSFAAKSQTKLDDDFLDAVDRLARGMASGRTLTQEDVLIAFYIAVMLPGLERAAAKSKNKIDDQIIKSLMDDI